MAAGLCAGAADGRRRRALRRALGAAAGAPQGEAQGRRRRHHAAFELHHALRRDRAAGRSLARPEERLSELAVRPRRGGVPDPALDQRPSRRAACAHRRDPRLVDDGAHHARLQNPRRRLQSRGLRICRHQGRARDHHRGADLRRACGPRRRRRGRRRALPGDLGSFLRLRLRRHRHRDARRAEPGRRRPGRALLRHHLQRRRHHGARHRRADLPRRRDPGHCAGVDGRRDGCSRPIGSG